MKLGTVQMGMGALVIGACGCGAYGGVTPCIDPLLLSQLDLNANSLGVEVVGNTAYMSQSGNGLDIVDVTDALNPVLLGSYEMPFDAIAQVAVDDVNGVAYLADGNNGLVAVDVGDPVNPFQIGFLPFANCHAVKISGTRAFAAILGEFAMVDISDPANMSVIGFGVPAATASQDVFVVGSVAYVANANQGLWIYDVSTTAINPALLGSIDFGGIAVRVFVEGTTAYVTQIAGPSDHLVAIDVSDPANPFVLGTFDTPGDAWNVDVVGTTAYVADQFSGLSVVDVSDPTMMSLISNYDTPGQGFDVVVDGSTAYLAETPGGLMIFDVGNSCLCGADLTNDGNLNFLDVSAFLAAFGVMDPVADFNNDGSFNFLDVSAFLAAFGAGCP